MDEKKVREAIEAFQGQVDWLKRIDDKGCEESRRCCIEYFETAIEALEKQLPKKPKENGIYSGTFKKTKAYTCPTCCNCCLEKMMNERQDTDFCWNCGQKLDWSETEI